MSHTKGPWHVKAPPVADNGNPWMVQDADYHTLAIVNRSPREANAKLMAAAPDLLDALLKIASFDSSEGYIAMRAIEKFG